ncbi:MAG TPA: DHA2 family efflux MFS transporter permease subunit [Opitutaceae bacterium]|nr:DHA2 family efflux MFS transporter permease subunit [Opitutaceae bacterium]
MSAAQTGLYGSDRSLLSPYAARLLDRGVLKWVIAITAALGAVLEVIDTSIVNVALPDIQGNLGSTLSEAGWVSTGYACANVVIIPLTAWLSNRFGRKQYLLFSLVGFTAASAMCGMAANLPMLVVARVLQGLAGGGLLAKAQSILFETFSRAEQAAAQAIFGIGVISGPALGPVLGGYLTDTLGWRWIFFINLPFGVLAVLMTIAFLPRDRPEEISRDRVDWAGIGLLAIGLGCFQTMLEQGQEDDWFGSRLIVWMAVGSVVGIGLFIWRELSIDFPAVDLRALKFRSLSAGSAYSLVLGMGLYGIVFAIPVFVQEFLHFTAMQSGILQLPSAVAAAFAMIMMGRIAGRVDARLLIGTGAMITVVAALWLAQINPDTSAGSLFWPLFLRGLGSVCMFLPLSLATLGDLPKDKVASGAGFYNVTRQLGSSIGIATITTVLAYREAVHRAVLVVHEGQGNPGMVRRLGGLEGALSRVSSDPAGIHARALKMLDMGIDAQSMLLSFADVFRYVAIAFMLSLPLLLLLGRGRNRAALAAAH